eukprot:1643437-Alexandrium_andersonii.AAC.1
MPSADSWDAPASMIPSLEYGVVPQVVGGPGSQPSQGRVRAPSQIQPRRYLRVTFAMSKDGKSQPHQAVHSCWPSIRLNTPALPHM